MILLIVLCVFYLFHFYLFSNIFHSVGGLAYYFCRRKVFVHIAQVACSKHLFLTPNLDTSIEYCSTEFMLKKQKYWYIYVILANDQCLSTWYDFLFAIMSYFKTEPQLRNPSTTVYPNLTERGCKSVASNCRDYGPKRWPDVLLNWKHLQGCLLYIMITLLAVIFKDATQYFKLSRRPRLSGSCRYKAHKSKVRAYTAKSPSHNLRQKPKIDAINFENRPLSLHGLR